MVMTTSQPEHAKTGLKYLNNDATLTSAILDRLLHHAETVLMQGQRATEFIDKIDS